MKLVIVESPAKAKTIQKYLGQEYRVSASGGHICDLPEKTLGIDVEKEFKPEYVLNQNKKELIRKLKQSVKESDAVYLATDPDREGEAISWHLANYLGIQGQTNRVEFNEISPKAVKDAIAQPRNININLVDAQQARRVLDRLVGYKVSPILSRKIKSGLSGGRVQSAALKMLVDREKEIKAFVPEEYWHLFAHLTKKEAKRAKIKALLSDQNGKKLKVSDGDTAKAIETSLQNAERWFVEKVKRGVSKSRPSPPFMTSTLQQDGSQKLGLTAPQVMQIAQQLYEGLDIPGEGHIALVTYIRTDSVRVSKEMQETALQFIKEKYGKDYAPAKPNFYATKSQNAQDAHEAIRPISLERSPESLKDKLPRNHYRLYKLIYDRFVASQMTEAIYNTLTVRVQADVENDTNYGFKVQGKALVFAGYTAVYAHEKVDDDENVTEATLPDLVEGEELSLTNIVSEQKFTKPPARYTEATLIKAMEENGIGRPSTYATVMSVLSKREYAVKEQKFMKPTELGETVTSFMEEFFANIVDARFTAKMEADLDKIEQGARWQQILADFYPGFAKDVAKAFNNDKKMTVKEQVTDVKCDKCGAFMVIRDGRYGKFMACPNYPKCKNVKSIVEPVGTCPECGGSVTKCRSKAGRIFYGCSNYPNCRFMSWEIPAPILCPTCKSVMRVHETGERKTYICTKRDCKTTVVPKEEQSTATDNE